MKCIALKVRVSARCPNLRVWAPSCRGWANLPSCWCEASVVTSRGEAATGVLGSEGSETVRNSSKIIEHNNKKELLKDRFHYSSDSSSKEWKMTDKRVKLMKDEMAMPESQRCTGILQGFWNTFRKKISRTTFKQEEPEDSEMVSLHPMDPIWQH